MITFFCALILLIVGYMVYGRIVENVFKPDDRETPAIAKADGVGYAEMKPTKIFLGPVMKQIMRVFSAARIFYDGPDAEGAAPVGDLGGGKPGWGGE